MESEKVSLKLIEKGQETALKYPTSHVVKEFYEHVRDYGEELKRDELARDEELDLNE